MTDEQQALCLDNMRLVSHCAKKFLPSGIPWEELCSCGNLGLARAAATFVHEKNTRFSTYACRCIYNEIYVMLRQHKKHRMVESLDSKLSNAEGLRLIDILPGEEDMAEEAEVRLLAWDAMTKLRALPEKKRRVWELRYGLTGEPPLKQKDIAQRMGCSRARISWVLKEDLHRKIRGIS